MMPNIAHMVWVTVRVCGKCLLPSRIEMRLRFDASGEWVHGNVTTPITWAQQRTGSTTALTATPASPGVLQEFGDQASWGTLVLAAPNATGLTWQLGQDTVVRGASAGQGVLNNTSDTAQPRAINDRWPVLGFNQNLGTVTPRFPSAQFTVAIGHVRTPALSYLGTQLNPWWTHYWSTWPAMLDWFVADHTAVAAQLEGRIEQRRGAHQDRPLRHGGAVRREVLGVARGILHPHDALVPGEVDSLSRLNSKKFAG